MTDLILGNPIGELSKKRARGLSFFGFKTAVIANRACQKVSFFYRFTALRFSQIAYDSA